MELYGKQIDIDNDVNGLFTKIEKFACARKQYCLEHNLDFAVPGKTQTQYRMARSSVFKLKAAERQLGCAFKILGNKRNHRLVQITTFEKDHSPFCTSHENSAFMEAL